MIAKLFMSLTDYPAFRRIIWKPIYEVLAKKVKVADWHFMNYGYTPFQYEQPVTLFNTDELNRYPIQLYHYLATKIDIRNIDLLEVGSGRGGGASYIKTYLSPKKMVGVDIAHNAVKLANETHSKEGLQFIQGNAESLPLGNESFDAVINVESCHAYGSVPKFLTEVKRVLKPGGYFLCTDMRSPGGMEKLQNYLEESGMLMKEQEEITDNIIKAIELEEPVKQDRINKDIPKWFQKMFREFAGVRGSKIHEDLKSRGLVYYRFVLQKQ
jgi:ubiquinone/menaquinone biosynthesis C-methylase UbiE